MEENDSVSSLPGLSRQSRQEWQCVPDGDARHKAGHDRKEHAVLLEDYRRECSDIAVMLEQDSQEALDRAIPRGRAAMESAFTEMKKRAVFARFFAFEARLHRVCPSRACKRARYCKGLSLLCTRGRVLDRDEEIYARGCFYAFIRIMRAPETEEEKLVAAKERRAHFPLPAICGERVTSETSRVRGRA